MQAYQPIENTDPVVKLLYHLMQDYLPAGKVTDLVYNTIDSPSVLTNGQVGKYAEYLAENLLDCSLNRSQPIRETAAPCCGGQSEG